MRTFPRLLLVVALLLSMAAIATAATGRLSEGYALTAAGAPGRSGVAETSEGRVQLPPPPSKNDPAPGKDPIKPLPPLAGNGSSTERVTALLTRGYATDDVHTALNLEQRTGIDALQFLLERKKGTDWPLVIDQIVQDKSSLTRVQSKSVELARLDRETVSYYQDQGYALLDLYEAAELAAAYDLDLAQVFTYKGPDLDWRQVEIALQMRNNPILQDGRMDLSFGEERRESTLTGLHKSEIYRLMDEGYALEQILTADNLTRQVEATVEEVLATYRQGQDWNRILQEFPRKELVLTDQELSRTTGLDVQTVASLRAQGYSSSDLLRANQVRHERGELLTAVLEAFEKAGRNWQQADPPKGPTVADLARTMNMDETRVATLLQADATWQEVLQANDRAQQLGRLVETELEAIIAQRGKRITHISFLYELLPDGTPVEIKRTRSGLTLEDVNRLLPEFYWGEIMEADQLAAELGLGATKILDALRQGMEFEAIRQQYNAKSTDLNKELQPETTPESRTDASRQTLAAVAELLGVPAHLAAGVALIPEESDALLSMGFSDEETLVISLIATATSRPVLAIAPLKTSGNTWLDVARLAKKGGEQ